MKLSKKILSFILPIASTAIFVPVITSCNKSESINLIYGDNVVVNCYQKIDGVDSVIHSLGAIQNEVKNHVKVWQESDYVSQDELNEYAKSYKNIYYDLLASLSILNNEPFCLVWKVATDNIAIDIYTKASQLKINAKTFSYTNDGDVIKLQITGTDSSTQKFTSYAFKSIKLK